jgi:hypothetical protein
MQKKSAAGGITNQWYNSEMGNWAFYGQENPPDGMDIQLYGHFTQVVWKDSTKVGCATVKCPAGSVLQYPSWYTVCNYNPQGKSYTPTSSSQETNVALKVTLAAATATTSSSPRVRSASPSKKARMAPLVMSGKGCLYPRI